MATSTHRRDGLATAMGKTMRFQISQQGGGKYAVIDIRTRQIRFCGSLDGARQAQARLMASER